MRFVKLLHGRASSAILCAAQIDRQTYKPTKLCIGGSNFFWRRDMFSIIDKHVGGALVVFKWGVANPGSSWTSLSCALEKRDHMFSAASFTTNLRKKKVVLFILIDATGTLAVMKFRSRLL